MYQLEYWVSKKKRTKKIYIYILSTYTLISIKVCLEKFRYYQCSKLHEAKEKKKRKEIRLLLEIKINEGKQKLVTDNDILIRKSE